MTASVLDDIAGLGPARRKRLLGELGGLRGVKAASLETLEALPWLPAKVAQAVFDGVHGEAATVGAGAAAVAGGRG
jgi:excinuclease ABC subunit C